ncbi:hypothetical protein EES39_09450 [Streptomyces sp. ADI92-24]|nr:hypothetical protein EES39_09450 [Streptomyces sp. ADI92-24]
MTLITRSLRSMARFGANDRLSFEGRGEVVGQGPGCPRAPNPRTALPFRPLCSRARSGAERPRATPAVAGGFPSTQPARHSRSITTHEFLPPPLNRSQDARRSHRTSLERATRRRSASPEACRETGGRRAGRDAGRASGAGSGTRDAVPCRAGSVLRDAPAGAHPGGERYRSPVARTPDLVSARYVRLLAPGPWPVPSRVPSYLVDAPRFRVRHHGQPWTPSPGIPGTFGVAKEHGDAFLGGARWPLASPRSSSCWSSSSCW